MRRMHQLRTLIVATALVVAGSPTASAASGRTVAPQAALACELAEPLKVIPKIFGLPHVSFIGRETTTPQAGHATYCDVGAWRATPPSSSVLQKLGSGSTFAHQVPPGTAVVVVGTQVGGQDPVATYDMLAGSMAKLKLLHGGGVVAAPSHGATRHYAVWIGGKDHASGVWLIGNGVIEILVESSGGTASTKLLDLAQDVVPQIHPVRPVGRSLMPFRTLVPEGR